jgi:tetratricopeptide (TPR) repeat protein
MRRALVLLACALALASGPAAADVASEARFFDALGRRAYAAGQYDRALESFQLAQDIAPSDRLLYNIALCSDLAGRAEMAFSLYQEYLKSDDRDAARRAEAVARAERVKDRLALVAVESDPEEAAIYVDRKELGQFGSTPATIAVPAGERRVLIERAGFAPQTVTVGAKLGTLVPVRVVLTPVHGWASVKVTPKASKLRFLRDGAEVQAISERGRLRLPAGAYRVRAMAPGHQPAEAALLVPEQAETALELELVPLPRPTGRLLVSAGKIAADVFVDGKRMAVTPAALPVGAGAHWLEVRAGRRAVRRRIVIEKARAKYVEVDLGSGAR